MQLDVMKSFTWSEQLKFNYRHDVRFVRFANTLFLILGILLCYLTVGIFYMIPSLFDILGRPYGVSEEFLLLGLLVIIMIPFILALKSPLILCCVISTEDPQLINENVPIIEDKNVIPIVFSV